MNFETNMDQPRVISVSKSSNHTFHKYGCEQITLIKGLGVAGDAHAGKTVKHRSRVAKDPSQPNLRQVHLIHSELFDELAKNNFVVNPGDLGENITTRNIDLLALPKGSILRIGEHAQVEITGLRNPCSQLDKFQDGLKQAVLDFDEKGQLVRKSGIMGVVLESGEVFPDDKISIQLPEGEFVKLDRV